VGKVEWAITRFEEMTVDYEFPALDSESAGYRPASQRHPRTRADQAIGSACVSIIAFSSSGKVRGQTDAAATSDVAREAQASLQTRSPLQRAHRPCRTVALADIARPSRVEEFPMVLYLVVRIFLPAFWAYGRSGDP